MHSADNDALNNDRYLIIKLHAKFGYVSYTKVPEIVHFNHIYLA